MPLNNFGLSAGGFRSGQPDRQGIEDCKALEIKTIFKLNSEVPEEGLWCDVNGIQLIESPIPTFGNTAAIIEAVGAISTAQ